MLVFRWYRLRGSRPFVGFRSFMCVFSLSDQDGKFFCKGQNHRLAVRKQFWAGRPRSLKGT